MERTCDPLLRGKFDVCQGNIRPCGAKKPIFGPLSKDNTGIAARRPAGNDTKHRVVSAIYELLICDASNNNTIEKFN